MSKAVAKDTNLKQLSLVFVLLAAGGAARSQTVPAGDSNQMQVPPSVSGQDYSTEVGAEERSNYLSMGFFFTTAYDDNVLGSVASKPVSDFTYSIRPSIAFDVSRPRQHASVSYTPGFTFYQQTSALNEQDEVVNGQYQYRLSPHIAAFARESFERTSSVFDSLGAISGGPVSGTPEPAPVIAPFATMNREDLIGGMSWQVSRNGMIGGTGTWGKFTYPHPSQATGLFDSSGSGGAAFYSTRLTGQQYFGVRYRYAHGTTQIPTKGQATQIPVQGQAEADINAINPFYTVFIRRTFSISLAGGPQHVNASQTGSAAKSSTWNASGTVSMGLQSEHTSLAASYSRSVSAAVGLAGVYNDTGASLAGRWQMSPKWTAGIDGTYQSQSNAAPTLIGTPGGHTILGTVQLQHPLTERLRIEFGYDRLHQSYKAVNAIANSPDSNREYFSIYYQLERPLGR